MKNKYLSIIFIVMLVAIFGFSYFTNVYAIPNSQESQVQFGNDGGSGGSPGSSSSSSDSSDDSALTGDNAWLTSSKVSCGPIGNIPAKVPEIFSLLVLLFEIAVPVILVIIGMIDLSKGVMSQKEDEIKKGQQTFIKRLIAGALIFFIVALVKILVGAVGGGANNKAGIVSCMNCFLNGDCVAATTTP